MTELLPRKAKRRIWSLRRRDGPKSRKLHPARPKEVPLGETRRTRARLPSSKTLPRGSNGPPTGAPPKPNEVGLVGRGGAAERLSFCPERQNEGCGACDDEARLSPLSFFKQRKMGPPEVASCRARPVKTQNKTIAPPEAVSQTERPREYHALQVNSLTGPQDFISTSTSAGPEALPLPSFLTMTVTIPLSPLPVPL